MELRWVTRRSRYPNAVIQKLPPLTSPGRSSMPLYISANSSHADPLSVHDLLASCNLSCERFPKLGHEGRVVIKDDFLEKLRISLANSCVVVSVFCRPKDLISVNGEVKAANQGELGFRSLMSRAVPSVGPGNGKLVGFGRAVSDLGLTASIYYVML